VVRCFGVLSVHPVPTDSRKEVGSENHECAYCGVALAGARCIRRRRSTGFGRANEVIERFCGRRCRGLFDERGPKWSNIDEHNDDPDGEREGRPQVLRSTGWKQGSEA
jgi:hypothetical protein